MNENQSTWKDVVIDALRELGGQAHLSEINDVVERNPRTATNPTWRDTIRRVVRQYTVFQPVPPQRSGMYRLVETDMHQASAQDIDAGKSDDITHGIAQGMLITLGTMYGYETFAPTADQSTREFQEVKLQDLVTVREITDVVRGPNVKSVRQIDVLWLAEDDDGLFPVYGFEVEHTTRVKDGLDRLMKIPGRFAARLFIVAPDDASRLLFDRYTSQMPFRPHRNRFAFRAYDQLEEVYNAALKHKQAQTTFGVEERWSVS